MIASHSAISSRYAASLPSQRSATCTIRLACLKVARCEQTSRVARVPVGSIVARWRPAPDLAGRVHQLAVTSRAQAAIGRSE